MVMEVTCKDPFFGDMVYKHRWLKTQKVELFEREWEIIVAARAYSGKPITEQQQKAYQKFTENEMEMLSIVEKNIKKYIEENFEEVSQYCTETGKMFENDEVDPFIIPKTLLFKQDGTVIMLLDCVWDKEHGIGVKLIPEVGVGSQDLFL